MSAPGTFDISEILRALGSRTTQIVPSIGLTLQPVVVMGDFSQTFSAETIEARGITQGDFLTVGFGQWAGVYLQILSAGGVVVEKIAYASFFASVINSLWFRCSEIPWAGGTFNPIFPIGGQTVLSRWNEIVNEPGPRPDITLLKDGLEWQGEGGLTNPQLLERWWLKPGSFLGFITEDPNAHPFIRFREIPEAQGAP